MSLPWWVWCLLALACSFGWALVLNDEMEDFQDEDPFDEKNDGQSDW